MREDHISDEVIDACDARDRRRAVKQDERFRMAMIAAHPQFAPPVPVVPPEPRVRDILHLSSPAADALFAGPHWRRLVVEVAVKHGYRLNEMVSVRRDKKLVVARQEAMYRLKTETAMSLPAIGKRFGRDHTTVLYSVRRHEERMRAGQGDTHG